MNYHKKFLLFIICFILCFYTLRTAGESIYRTAYEDLGGIPWLFSTIGLIFSILSGFLIQHLWDKWERIQKIILEEIHALEHMIMFTAPNAELHTKTKALAARYITYTIKDEWSPNTQLLDTNSAIDELKGLHDEFLAAEQVSGFGSNRGVLTKLLNTLLYIRQRRILLTTRRMPSIIKSTFFLSAILVIFLSLFVGIKSVLFDFIFTVSIGSLVFAIYLIVDDMDDILSPGAWHVSSKLYKDFLKKIE